MLRNDDPDCVFFAWENFGNEFYNVQSVFDMPEERINLADHLSKNKDTSNFYSSDTKVRYYEL